MCIQVFSLTTVRMCSIVANIQLNCPLATVDAVPAIMIATSIPLAALPRRAAITTAHVLSWFLVCSLPALLIVPLRKLSRRWWPGVIVLRFVVLAA